MIPEGEYETLDSHKALGGEEAYLETLLCPSFGQI